MINFGLTFAGDIIIGLAAFAAGAAFSNQAKMVLGWFKAAYDWIKGKF